MGKQRHLSRRRTNERLVPSRNGAGLPITDTNASTSSSVTDSNSKGNTLPRTKPNASSYKANHTNSQSLLPRQLYLRFPATSHQWVSLWMVVTTLYHCEIKAEPLRCMARISMVRL